MRTRLNHSSRLVFYISSILLLGCCSCDVVSTFSVYNKSGERKLVEVVGIERDSIGFESMFFKNKANRRSVIEKNSLRPSCTFYLEPNQTAWLEWGWGRGYSTRQVIINKSDTVQTIKTIWRDGKPPKNKYLAHKKRFYTVGGDYEVILK